MIKYILIGITILFIVLVGYTQMNKQTVQNITINESRHIEKKMTKDKSNTKIKEIKSPNEVNAKRVISQKTIAKSNSKDTDEMLSELNQEMAGNEKEMIKQLKEQKEDLTITYNMEEEEAIPDNDTLKDNDNMPEESFLDPEELNKVEQESELQPVIEESFPSAPEDDTPMTSDKLEEIEESTGLQETVDNTNNKPLEKEGFEPI